MIILYYERLLNIYRNTDLFFLYSEHFIYEFDLFIRECKNKGDKYLSPYKFAVINNMSINESVKFFLYYSKENGLLNIKYFFECTTPTCVSSRIFINGNDDVIVCDECDKPYRVDNIKHLIKVYFELKEDILIPDQINHYKKDINSTFETLKNLPDDLKFLSPSSEISPNSIKSNCPIDEGEIKKFSVELGQVVESNYDTKGNQIANINYLKDLIIFDINL